MQLSIITVNLNNKDGLQKTIDSIISQSCRDFEWIVIDGNSTDGSKELLEINKKNITYWISEPDNGIYDGMNKGIMKAKGEYLLFLNSGDILYSKDSIKEVLQNELEKDIIVYDIILQKEGKLIKKDLSNLSKLSLVSFLFRSTFPHQSTLIKKNLFITSGLYSQDYKYISDWVFFYNTCVIGDASFLYKQDKILSIYDMSGISSVNRKKAHAERTSFLKAHYSPRMYQYMKKNYLNEKQLSQLQRPWIRSFIKCLLWISNKF